MSINAPMAGQAFETRKKKRPKLAAYCRFFAAVLPLFANLYDSKFDRKDAEATAVSRIVGRAGAKRITMIVFIDVKELIKKNRYRSK